MTLMGLIIVSHRCTVSPILTSPPDTLFDFARFTFVRDIFITNFLLGILVSIFTLSLICLIGSIATFCAFALYLPYAPWYGAVAAHGISHHVTIKTIILR
ncbi:hypothetical protein BKM25_17970 [Pseudomonas avellanae]|nr:hypothetical protein AO261_10740 [Pseudomonas avellanae]POD20461.1 hypothetical protein BKM05_19330 [Pseudomonas avellanae]POR74709.1 hypothetical protein BKM25_17970 [Pseudomonas avellanae]